MPRPYRASPTRRLFSPIMPDDSFSFEALGTVWFIICPKGRLSESLKKQILDMVLSFQADYSRFDPASILSRLNDNKRLNNPPKEMLNMLEFGLEMYAKSGGIFNMSVGSKLEQDGYGKTSDDNARISKNLPDDITISEKVITLASHVRLDFGGFGKGWLVDKLHDFLNSLGVKQHIINGGGDIRVGAAAEEIFIEHPVDNSLTIGRLRLKNEAFAASSNLKRQWKSKSGQTKAHIINPNSSPIVMPLLICARAKNCLLADTTATILFLLPPDQRSDFAKMQNVAYLEVDDDLQFEQTPDFGLYF